MNVYVTKYALARGIIEVELLANPIGDETSAFVEWQGRYEDKYGGRAIFLAGEWHPDRSAAVARAEEMRKTKIASLKTQIARLEALKWEVE